MAEVLGGFCVLALLDHIDPCHGKRAQARALGQGVTFCSYVQAPARACALPAGSNPWPPASLALLPSQSTLQQAFSRLSGDEDELFWDVTLIIDGSEFLWGMFAEYDCLS